MNSDAEMLRQFASTGDETAFRGLVERHAAMVLGVAWRRTQDRALAEDVTQTVFTILARKARSLRHEELAGWLHRTAFLETRNACRKERRRQEALRELIEQMNEEPQSDSAWQEIRPHLDEAMTRLSPEERQLVVLRYFEQRSYKEIADATGKSEEASRKQMQRSLDRLGGLLRKRGIATSGAALGTVLAAQTLTTAPASASVIAAAALQAAPMLATSTILTYSFATMTASTILKTAAVAIVLAAIPIVVLWKQNSGLRQENEELRVAAAASATAPKTPAVIPQDEISRKTSTGKPAISAAPEKEKQPANPLEGLSGLFNAETIVSMAEGQMRQEAEREFNRLALRLKLTDEQKTKLRAFLDEKMGADVKDMKDALGNGLLTRLMKGEGALSEADKAAIATMDAEERTGPEQEEFLKTILTPEQQAEYAKAKEEKRVADAEEAANTMMASISKHVDLTAEQKDQIFQTLAQKALAKPPADPNKASPAEALSAAMPEFDRGNDEAIRGILTPEQFALFDKSRTEEEKQAKELIKTFVPWLPQEAETESKPE